MAKDKTVEKKRKFSLIDLLMIIMVVGIALTLIIPLRNDTLTKNRLSEAIRNAQIIANADNAFKDDPANG
ncbi:MAG TPA: type II secretion system protein, partial [Candidatus Cloacimonadota bacterium]|nr:type II secretion system protein [Candidatus Cloacimonadota bacterium]